MEKNLSLATIAVVGLAAGSGLATAQSQTPVTVSAENRAEQINLASITSMEESYLKVPRICKAGHATFDPQIPSEGALIQEVLAIHRGLA